MVLLTLGEVMSLRENKEEFVGRGLKGERGREKGEGRGDIIILHSLKNKRKLTFQTMHN